MSEMFDGTLDLTGADPDEVGFPPIPSGVYEAHVAKAEWRTTENIDGSKKMPHGTPMLALGIQVNEDEPERDGQKVANMYVWTNLLVPPADYDAAKAQTMKNRMANFLNAIGEDWQKKGYKIPDVEQLVGQQVTVTVKKTKDGNNVEGFKPAGSSQTAESGMLV
jgi:Protein of unknown function (DUF669)